MARPWCQGGVCRGGHRGFDMACSVPEVCAAASTDFDLPRKQRQDAAVRAEHVLTYGVEPQVISPLWCGFVP